MKVKDWVDAKKINWNELSQNPNAIALLEKLNWFNPKPGIFTYDYSVIKEDRKELNEEIVQCFYHPKRMSKWIESGETMDEFINIYG
jgi:hypothetical protein